VIKFDRIAAMNALSRAINEDSNYSDNQTIDWELVDTQVYLELYDKYTCENVPISEHYLWYDRAVALYIDEFGEPTLGKIYIDGLVYL
jgi:hypothetical protein